MKRIEFLICNLLATTLISCNFSADGKRDENHEMTLKGIEIQDKKADSLNEKGVELSKKGDYKAGRLSFLKALEIEPYNPTILSNLGLNRFLDYDYLNAIDYYQKSYKYSDSTYHIAAVNLGLAYYHSKKFENGIEITNYVIENSTDDSILSTAYVHRALNFIGLKNCPKAESDLNYIKLNYAGIRRMDYHIGDLTKKIKSCLQQGR